jgi:hypothetical protein
MERKVNIQDWQKVTVEDFNNFGLFPRSSFDHIVGDTLIPTMAYTGFTAVQTAPAVVTVGNGRLYHAGLVFYNDSEGGSSLDLLGVLPVVTRRYVGVVVWGQEVETDTEPRTFLTDPVTRATVARVVSTENRRWANVSTVVGAEGPDPQHPSVASNTLAVAWILLDSTGIVSIQMVDENRAPNLTNLDDRMNEMDAWRAGATSRLDTLATDMASLALRINGTASMRFVMKVAADVARVKEVLNLPDTYSSWGADHFLTTDESDVTHVDYLAKIEEGIRFPDAAQRDAQMGLLNPMDPAVINQANFVLPVYDPVTRLEVLGKDSDLSISQYQYQTISWELCAKTRTRVRWGTAFYVCANGVWWFAPSGRDWVSSINSGESQGAQAGGMTPNTDLIFDPIKNILTRGNETFMILDVQDNPNHTILRLAQYWVDEIIDSYYWRQVVTIEGLSGSVVSQTFLNSQGGWLIAVELFFSRIAATGDVHCLICECNTTGSPNFEKTIARSTKPADLLRIDPNATKFDFLPTYLAKGIRYAIVLQTAGNHFISLVHNNKFAQGSLFSSTDGAWSVGDLTKDMAFRLNFAKFRSNRCEVQLLSLELNGGMAAIDLNFDSTRPPGTTISFEVQITGNWVPLGYYASNPLIALPPLLPFRVLLVGTTDEMPGLGVAALSRMLTSRPRSDFRHISTARTTPGPVTTVYCDFRLESWRGPPYHTFTPRLLVGAGYVNVRTPSLIQDEIDPNDPTTLVRSCTWNLAALGGAAITSYKIRSEGTTDNVLATYLVGERVDIAIA